MHRWPLSVLIQHYSLTKNCNHKRIGLYYLLSSFLFGLSGTVFSVLIRLELYSSGNRIISPENQNFYNISITLHGLLMIFFLVMPGLFGGFGKLQEKISGISRMKICSRYSIPTSTSLNERYHSTNSLYNSIIFWYV